MFSKNAEVQAVQREIDNLKARFEHKTTELLAEQQMLLEAEGKVLKDTVKGRRRALTKVKELMKEAETDLSSVRADMILAQDDLEATLKAIDIAQDDLRGIQEKHTQVEDGLVASRDALRDVELSVSKLQTEENRLLDSISAKERALYDLERQEVNAQDTFSASEVLRNKQLAVLDAKLLAVVDEIEQKTQEYEVTRRSLAEWQTRLEAQDQNLRIRESKVAEGETKIVRNSNLLNL